MTVRKIYTNGGFVEVKGSPLSSEGEFISLKRKIDPKNNNSLRLTLEIGVLCNNASMVRIKENRSFGKIASLVPRTEKWELSGDPTEAALLVAGAKGDVPRSCSMKVIRELMKYLLIQTESVCR